MRFYIAYGKSCTARRVFCVILWLLANCTLQAQTMDTLAVQKGAIVIATLDPLNQIIVATTDGRVQRYDSLGQATPIAYTNARLGAPDQIDATDPLRVVLYYQAFQTVKLLNRNLIEIATIDLNTLGYTQIPAVCAARDGSHLWLFDASEYRFLKLDMQGKVGLEGPRINTVTRALPTYMRDHGDHLIAYLDDYQVFEPTPFGDVHKMQRFAGRIWSLTSTDDAIFVVRDSEIKRYGYDEVGDPTSDLLATLPDLAGARCQYLGKGLGLLVRKDGWAVVRWRL